MSVQLEEPHFEFILNGESKDHVCYSRAFQSFGSKLVYLKGLKADPQLDAARRQGPLVPVGAGEVAERPEAEVKAGPAAAAVASASMVVLPTSETTADAGAALVGAESVAVAGIASGVAHGKEGAFKVSDCGSAGGPALDVSVKNEDGVEFDAGRGMKRRRSGTFLASREVGAEPVVTDIVDLTNDDKIEDAGENNNEFIKKPEIPPRSTSGAKIGGSRSNLALKPAEGFTTRIGEGGVVLGGKGECENP